jgi:anaerobic selenocysteine-containing dehydrogenase/Fe-S-cluster-containing dehydrogenase component
MSAEVSRRSFLKLAAATGAAAAIPGCKPAARHLVPYVVPEEYVIPGMPTFYATACDECAAGCGVIARVREGRVIKLEGNPADPVSQGSLCARGQAALQGLYNPDRLTRPHRRDAHGLINPVSWDDAMAELAAALRQAQGKGADRVAFIGPPVGPTYDRVIAQWMQAVNSKLRLTYEPLTDAADKEALRFCFGQEYTPVYSIDRAKVLVSFGADFVETWHSPVELARQYAAFRAPTHGPGGAHFGLSYYVGPRMSLTASRCDHWFATRPGLEGAVALAMLRVIVDRNLVHPGAGIDMAALRQFVAPYDPAKVSAMTGVSAKDIERMAQNFGSADAAIALAGGDDTGAHAAAWLLNAVTGNVGKTVEFLPPRSGNQTATMEQAVEFVRTLHGGTVDVLVISQANLEFSLPAQAQFTDALSKVTKVIWCGEVPDETAAHAHLLLPTAHWLEEWSDGSPRAGINLLRQPTMGRVVYSRPLGDILLDSTRAAGVANAPADKDMQAAVKAAWAQLNQGGAEQFDGFWEQSLREGGNYGAAQTVAVRLQGSVLQTPLTLPEVSDQPALTMVSYPHIFWYDGRGADKPWLQEIPEPVNQIVWDSWVEIHPQTAKSLDVVEGDLVQLTALSAPSSSIEVPAHITDAIHPTALGVPIGQGHTDYGRYANGRGANPWRLLPAGRLTVGVKAARSGGRRELVSPLYSPNMMERPIVEVMPFSEFAEGIAPKPFEEPYPQPWETYPDVDYPVHKWGMTIDLNACTGCSACIAACYAENNIAVVGKEQVAKSRIMSWIRIERYIPETADAPSLYMMPMLCQQCDHAPCEPVCPVFASSHNDEGLNLQVYNRCVGTRYCENNCPYKVRRFNWYKPEFDFPLNLQLNPDVTVRGAGVMEKCTFCVQRIRAAEIVARVDNRELHDGEIIPACAEACPTHAITFGDTKITNAAVNQRRKDNQLRAYKALSPLNTRPAITYLRQVYRPRGEA